MLQCRYHEDHGDETALHDPRGCGSGKLGGSCRECTLRRSDPLSEVEGWIRGNTKTGPALKVAVTHHQGRYGIDIMIQSFSGDGPFFLGHDREWNKQVRYGDDRGDPR